MIKEWLQKQRAKSQLRKAFQAAGLYVTYRSGERELKVFPKIHSVINDIDRIEYVFTLISGMDPKEVLKKEYVFQQVFGQHVQLGGDYKRFTLTIYHRGLPNELSYSFEKIKPHLEGLALPIICGMDRYGQYIAYDAIQEPHLLIAGESGSGKSTQLRSILTTLIQYYDDSKLHIYCADLKMSEFHIFKRCRQVMAVCTTPGQLKKMLSLIQIEMNRRSQLLNEKEVAHINDLPESERPPIILICIDELVVVKDEKDIMDTLVQLVAIGRALNMIVILSMQRPSHDILDTKIRANLTVRMGFRAADLSNAKIIGTPGAEKISIEQRGRFLLKREGLTEIQAPFLSMERAKKILAAYKVADRGNVLQAGLDMTDPQDHVSEEMILGVLDDGSNQT
ncbi:FtsK/SpoIIIE domain-containing protein [Geobacillus sp. JS12]|uniref:FtsK/SpoIIIE domain-containing protein n=1 Tax=Geobacillus sp. JS12 TaxID=1813182 RepID=UPI00078B5ED0|nr:FtsK/SpoIIIE domain-containing protein [Geobacillus sp. JS12]AMQ19676.1 chromosome partitioning protein ParA [Geobacillus sp. JS12]